MQSAPLAKLLGNTEAVYQLQIMVYEHRMRTSVNVSPKDLKNLLIESIKAYPHNVNFLKKFLELNRAFNMRYFLQTNLGNGNYN